MDCHHPGSDRRLPLERYLSNAAGDKFAFDKGYGDRDKMAEWIIKEIKEHGGIAYIRSHAPYIFGIPLAVADT